MDVSDIFYFFLFWGGGKGEASEEAARGAGLNKKQREGGWGGGFPRRRRGRGKGAGGMSVRRGGGAKYFFSGPKCPPSLLNLRFLVEFLQNRRSRENQKPPEKRSDLVNFRGPG